MAREHDLERRLDPPDGATGPAPPPVARVLIVGAPSESTAPAEPARPEPLQIHYTATRRLPDVLVRLRRNVGVVKPDGSELAEAFKMLRNQVVHRMRADGHRILAVTSARSMPGKSLSALNLALTMAADIDSAVMLVDGDLSRHGLQQVMGLEGQPGLADYILDERPLQDLLVNPGVDRLVFLPAGAGTHANSAELLAARSAQHLMHDVKSRYGDRWIVVDLPPLLDTADALAFLPWVDTTLLVVEDHVTAQSDLEAAARLLAPFNLVGTVVSRGGSPQAEGAAPAPWYRRWWSRTRPARAESTR